MPARVVDFRSDTVTHPTQEMRDAMREAAVGDDVYGEDPTVNELQELAAKKMGKEAALFVPSGTMGNEIAVFVLTHRRGEILCEQDSHLVLYETGGPAVLSGVQIRTLVGRRGVLAPSQVAGAIRDPSDAHEPLTTLVGIENTHNMAGGTVWTAAQTAAVADVAHDRGIPVHLDGARIFNSAVAQDVPAASLAKPVDTVMFCLSKGLSAPVGSLVCGSREFIQEAHRARKLLGGGMRQAGILGAAGLVALNDMVDRLKEDHRNARRLALGMTRIPGFGVDMEAVQTNIVFADVAGTGRDARSWQGLLEGRGLRCSAYGPRRLRFVTHRHVTTQDVDWSLGVLEDAAGPGQKPTRAPGRRVAPRA